MLGLVPIVVDDFPTSVAGKVQSREEAQAASVNKTPAVGDYYDQDSNIRDEDGRTHFWANELSMKNDGLEMDALPP